jgi:hypothetical protein
MPRSVNAKVFVRVNKCKESFRSSTNQSKQPQQTNKQI